METINTQLLAPHDVERRLERLRNYSTRWELVAAGPDGQYYLITYIAGKSRNKIWAQLQGRIDGFTCAAGTGGTIAGVGLGLKAQDEKVRIALTDPHGAALYNYYAHGELAAEGSSVAEGIGQGRITANLDGAPIDTQFRISDEEGLEWVARLLKEEGLCLGLSSGINVAGAVAQGKQLVAEGREKPQVVTILCDSGFRYLSTIFNAAWLREKDLPVFDWLAD